MCSNVVKKNKSLVSCQNLLYTSPPHTSSTFMSPHSANSMFFSYICTFFDMRYLASYPDFYYFVSCTSDFYFQLVSLCSQSSDQLPGNCEIRITIQFIVGEKNTEMFAVSY